MNGKKAAQRKKLQAGDSVKLFLAEDTIEKFIEQKHTVRKRLPGHMPEVIYEDADVLLLNKPAGMFVTKANPSDVSGSGLYYGISAAPGRRVTETDLRRISSLESVIGWTGIHPDLLQQVKSCESAGVKPGLSRPDIPQVLPLSGKRKGRQADPSERLSEERSPDEPGYGNTRV